VNSVLVFAYFFEAWFSLRREESSLDNTDV